MIKPWIVLIENHTVSLTSNSSVCQQVQQQLVKGTGYCAESGWAIIGSADKTPHMAGMPLHCTALRSSALTDIAILLIFICSWDPLAFFYKRGKLWHSQDKELRSFKLHSSSARFRMNSPWSTVILFHIITFRNFSSVIWNALSSGDPKRMRQNQR
jgi:hypothetical protein